MDNPASASLIFEPMQNCSLLTKTYAFLLLAVALSACMHETLALKSGVSCKILQLRAGPVRPVLSLSGTSSLFKTPISTWGKSKVKGGRPARGRVPGRTCRRSNYCGFAEVLGLFRAELYRMYIGLGELKMTACSFRTSLTKWDPVTGSNS